MAEELYATLETTEGNIEVRLFPDQAPKTVGNFVGLAEGTTEWTDPRTGSVKKGESLYAGTVFHPDLRFDKPYLLAMANAGPGTNGSQFFITVAPTDWLNRKHTIFGEVTAGSDIVDAIATAPTAAQDRPRTDIVIERINIERRSS
jgi:peptidyl-prolyl cis-trans isomerase A (cyclophilin A)